ncbi:MAG: hypothetical protein K8I00_12550 [Candidatus Omnitrophica bacterium]|nr:hypothetical protein [Candidatus Omnitrophota bacterium]
MKEDVFAILSAVMEIPLDSVSMESSKDTVENWDSLHQLNLVFALEDNFNIKFSDEDILQMSSIPQILTTLEKMMAGELSSGT